MIVTKIGLYLDKVLVLGLTKIRVTKYLLTLQSRYIPVMGSGVLMLRMMLNR